MTTTTLLDNPAARLWHLAGRSRQLIRPQSCLVRLCRGPKPSRRAGALLAQEDRGADRSGPEKRTASYSSDTTCLRGHGWRAKVSTIGGWSIKWPTTRCSNGRRTLTSGTSHPLSTLPPSNRVSLTQCMGADVRTCPAGRLVGDGLRRFLEQRRHLMADIIRRGFESLR